MIRCFRGVARDNPQYAEALKGNAFPRGGTATPEEHNLWTTEIKHPTAKACGI